METITEPMKTAIVADKLADLLSSGIDLKQFSANKVEEYFHMGLITMGQVKEWCQISSIGEFPRTYVPRFKTKPYRVLENDVEVWDEMIDRVHLERVGE